MEGSEVLHQRLLQDAEVSNQAFFSLCRVVLRDQAVSASSHSAPGTLSGEGGQVFFSPLYRWRESKAQEGQSPVQSGKSGCLFLSSSGSVGAHLGRVGHPFKSALAGGGVGEQREPVTFSDLFLSF